MARKTQNQFPEVTSIEAGQLWMNCQESDTGNQKKIVGTNLPFEINTGYGIWTWSNAIVDSDQGVNKVWYNNATQASATIVYISKVDLLGESYGEKFLNVITGTVFTVVESLSKGHRFETTGPIVDGGNYVKIPVTVTANIGSIGNASNVKIEGDLTTASVSTLASLYGWANYHDSTYTSISPLELRAGNSYTSAISIDGVSLSDETQWPSGIASPWNTTTDKLIAVNEGDVYDMRLTFKAQDGATPVLLDIYIDIGGGIGEIFRESVNIAKGAGTETVVSINTDYFTGSTFVANGGTISASTASNSSDLDLWDFELLIYRKYVGR